MDCVIAILVLSCVAIIFFSFFHFVLFKDKRRRDEMEGIINKRIIEGNDVAVMMKRCGALNDYADINRNLFIEALNGNKYAIEALVLDDRLEDYKEKNRRR